MLCRLLMPRRRCTEMLERCMSFGCYTNERSARQHGDEHHRRTLNTLLSAAAVGLPVERLGSCCCIPMTADNRGSRSIEK